MHNLQGLRKTMEVYGYWGKKSFRKHRRWTNYTENEGPARIQYKCLVPIYVFPEIKLLFPKRNIMFCLPVPTLIYFQNGLPILLQANMWTDPVNI
jgi:hypothetical protein